MTFPVLPAHELGLVVAVVIGFGFGFVLERAGFGRAPKLAAQFYGTDMTVFKVMFSAIVTAMLGLVLASTVGLADFKAVADHAASATFLLPMVAGGFLLGAGFIMSGYCPGTSFVAMASGKLDGLYTVLGVIAGQVAWSELEWRPGFAWFHNAGNFGNYYLWELFHLPAKAGPVIVALAVTAMAVGCFLGAEKLEKVLAGRADPVAMATPAGRPGRLVFAGFAAVVLVGVAGLALPRSTQARIREAPAIGQLDLARRVFDEPWRLRVGDSMNEIDVARHSLMIDPLLHIWGWEIPVYLFLGGMAAGVMILTSLLMMRKDDRSPAVRWLAFAAPALVSVGMGALLLDLSFKLHAWRFYLAFRWTSPMSWGAWILVVVYPVSLALALAGLGDQQVERVAAFMGRFGLGAPTRALVAFGRQRFAGLLWVNLGVGAALGVYTGILLSTLGARALWNSAMLGPLFLASGLSTGAAFLMLFRLSEDERHFVTRWDKLAIGLEVAALLLFLAGLATSGAASKDAAALLLVGPWTASFWSLVVIAGLAVPLLLETLESRLQLRATVVTPLLVLAGGFALRWIMVAAGQA